MMARVSVPFTEGHYYGRGKRPNTELADNSSLPAGKTNKRKRRYFVIHNCLLHNSFFRS